MLLFIQMDCFIFIISSNLFDFLLLFYELFICFHIFILVFSMGHSKMMWMIFDHVWCLLLIPMIIVCTSFIYFICPIWEYACLFYRKMSLRWMNLQILNSSDEFSSCLELILIHSLMHSCISRCIHSLFVYWMTLIHNNPI